MREGVVERDHDVRREGRGHGTQDKDGQEKVLE